MPFFCNKGQDWFFFQVEFHLVDLPIVYLWWCWGRGSWFWKIGFAGRFEEHWLRLGSLAAALQRDLEIIFTFKAPDPCLSQLTWEGRREGGPTQLLEAASSLEKMSWRQSACRLQHLYWLWPMPAFFSSEAKLLFLFEKDYFLLFKWYPFYYEFSVL